MNIEVKDIKTKKSTDLICAYKVQMEACESTNKPQRNKTICHEYHRSRRFFHGLPNCVIVIIHQNFNIESRHGEDIHAKNSCRRNKHKEETVIALHIKTIKLEKVVYNIAQIEGGTKQLQTEQMGQEQVEVTAIDCKQSSIPVLYTGLPKDSGDQIVPHNCCRWSNASIGEGDIACMSHNT